MLSAATVRVIDTSAACPEISIVEGGGNSRVVLWPGNGAKYRSFQLIELSAGGRTIPLRHASDCVYYVMAGAGRVEDRSSGESTPLAEGAMIHIDAGDEYALSAETDGFRLVGGPCPPDEALYAALETLGETL